MTTLVMIVRAGQAPCPAGPLSVRATRAVINLSRPRCWTQPALTSYRSAIMTLSQTLMKSRMNSA